MTLEQIIDKVRAKMVETGECWDWTGAVQSAGNTPVMRLNDRPVGVRRAILIAKGMRLTGGLVATFKCGNPACVNPDHIIAATRATVQRLTYKRIGPNPVRNAHISATARARSRINMELAERIRAEERPQRAIASDYGISQYMVSKIKRGEAWVPTGNPWRGLL